MSHARQIVAVDIGGTHARFALATLQAGQRAQLSDATVLRTADFSGLADAVAAFRDLHSQPLPAVVALCVAAPVREKVIELTNSAWVIDQDALAADLGVDEVCLLNDFGAMAWAVSQLRDDEMELVCGTRQTESGQIVTSVIGPGTGLGVAQLLQRGSVLEVIETEGGHVDFAPLDRLEGQLVDCLRRMFPRLSTERIVSGPGLNNLYQALTVLDGGDHPVLDDAALWQSALAGENATAAKALERFCLSYGAVTGDLALAHGANRVVLVGGLSQRLMTNEYNRSCFARRFCAKGRYQDYMSRIAVYQARYGQMGLLGAATAYACGAKA